VGLLAKGILGVRTGLDAWAGSRGRAWLDQLLRLPAGVKYSELPRRGPCDEEAVRLDEERDQAGERAWWSGGESSGWGEGERKEGTCSS
jgi:hypothetical protein